MSLMEFDENSEHCRRPDPCRHLEKELKCVCQELQQLPEKIIIPILQALDTVIPCPPMPITAIPVTLLASGSYCIPENLVHLAAGPAITIAAEGIRIYGDKHSLTITNGAGAGIFDNGFNDLEVLDLTIQNAPGLIATATTNNALNLANLRKFRAKNLRVSGLARGIVLLGCRDVNIDLSYIENNFGGISAATGNPFGGGGIRIDSNNEDVTISRCNFFGQGPNSALSNIAILNTGSATSRNIKIRDCKFTMVDSCAILLNLENFTMEGCDLNMGPNVVTNMLQLGSTPAGGIPRNANAVTIRDCRFHNVNAGSGFGVFLLLSGNGALLQDLVFNTSTSGNNSGALIVGLRSINTAYNNVKIIDTVIGGSNTTGVNAQLSNGLIFDNLVVTGAITGLDADSGVQALTVKNSEFQSNGTGINLRNGNTGSAIIETNVRNNTNGIVDQGSFNLLRRNNVYRNAAAGIVSNPTTQLVDNVTYNNPVLTTTEILEEKISEDFIPHFFKDDM